MGTREPIAGLEWLAGGLSMGTGLIHAWVMPAHFEEWWGYGLFFAAAATAQVLFGLALWTRAIGPEGWGGTWREARRGLFALGIVLNVGVIALYAVTRTVGIPFFGPEAGTVEAVGFLDVASKGIEAALVVCLVILWVRARAAVAAAGR